MESEVFGRDEPLERLDRFIAALPGGPGSVVIEGEAGIGKTTLWQAGVDLATQRGYQVLVCRPAESEVDLAYAGLADLLVDVHISCFEALPEPQRHALEVALLMAEPTGRPPDARAIFTAFGGILRALARDTPVLVAVDDEQWLDTSSVKALEFASRRLANEPVGVLASRRLEAGGTAHPGLTMETLRLAPLGPTALHELIAAHFGISLPRSTVLRAHRMTGGNPFFALELAEVLLTAGLPDASEPWPIPEDLRDMVAARLGLLEEPVRSVLLTAAATARPRIDGLDASALRAAEQAGIVTVGQHGRVHFAHPLLASAIYESAPPEERRRVHARLAAQAGDLEEQARHRALATDAPDEEVAELLHRAAARARARGAPDVAGELEERSYTLTPLEQSEQAWHRRAAAAEHHFFAGDLERARSLLVELVDGPVTGPPRSSALRLLGEICYRLGHLDAAVRHLRHAVDAAEGDAGSIARAEISFAFALFYSFGSFAEGNAAVQRALAAAERLGDDALLSGVLAASVAAELILGRGLDEEKLARALDLEDPEQSSPIERRPSLLAGFALLHAEEFDRARALLESLRTRLVERGEESDLPELLQNLARLECLAGNLDAAGDLADRGYELARQAGNESVASTTRAIRAFVDAHAGRSAETRAAAAEAVELADRTSWRFAAFWASTALGLLELSLGNDEAVVRTLTPSIEVVEQEGVIEPTRRPFLPDAIEALVRLGDVERGDRLAAMLEERARALDRRSAIVAAARCRALVLAARGDVPGALEALERLLAEDLRPPAPLELARTLIVKGHLERRQKRKRASRESLERALEICERIGAALWAERARDELRRISGRAQVRGALTPAEERVAVLAADQTNRQIAATLGLSERTVAANLSRAFRKLGVRRRGELGAWILGGGSAASGRQADSLRRGGRELATILFTDLVASTEKVRTLGDAAWASLLASHNHVVRRQLTRFAGEEVDTAGDGFLVLFAGPAEAIRCALAIRGELGRLGLEVRAGLHTGEVERRAHDKPRGIAIHIGARIMSLAGAGEVLLSTTTRDLVAGSGLQFDDRGEHELRGIEGVRHLFAAR